MGQLLTCPNAYHNGGLNPLSWPGSHVDGVYTKTSSSHLSGTTTTDNTSSQSLNETINSSRSGNLYHDSGGFYSNVQTKTSTVFKTKHFIGHLNGNTIKSGSSISASTESCWIRDVIGFHCEISSAPTGSGSEADSCGRVDNFRICAVYADTTAHVRIMEMTSGGVKLSSQAYNSNPSGWAKLSYKLNSSDATKVISGNWKLYGWIIRFEHKKTCGGGQKQKNCTGRVRYLRPIVSTNSSTDGSYTASQIVMDFATHLVDATSTSGRRSFQVLS